MIEPPIICERPDCVKWNCSHQLHWKSV